MPPITGFNSHEPFTHPIGNPAIDTSMSSTSAVSHTLAPPGEWPRKGSPSLRAALAGGLLALAFPPFPFGFLAHVAIAVALLAVRRASVQTAAWRGFVFGFVFHLATIYWTGWVSVPGMFTMVAVLGLYVSLVFAVYAFAYRLLGEKAVWLFPFFWTAHEYLRGLGDLAFPWTNLSLSQVHYLNLIQFADVTGDLGVSFWIVLVNVLVYRMIVVATAPRRRPIGAYAAAILLLIVVPFLYGWGTIDSLKSESTVRVGVLQGDIDSFHKWDSAYVDQSFAVYEAQSREAAARGAELIIWPETAAPVYLRTQSRYQWQLKHLAAETGVPMLIGTLEYSTVRGGYLRYNAAIVLDRNGIRPDYHAKMQLVPLGEWIPFSDKFRVLDKLDVGGAHFTAGKKIVLFDHPKGPYAAAICFESVFPEIIREFALHGARFLVNITNDGWYGMSSGPTQHALIAVFRAIETRRPVARSANTGISLLIDRAGRTHFTSRQYVPDCIVADIDLGPRDQETFFARHGMYVGQLCTALTGTFLLLAVFLEWRRRRLYPGLAAPPGANGMTDQ